VTSNPNPIDIHVGSRVRLRRTLLGMSQEKLGDALGLTFQQVQKYERGANRIGSSRLYKLSQILDVPVSFFFDDMSNDVASAVRPAGVRVTPDRKNKTSRPPSEARLALVSDGGLRVPPALSRPDTRSKQRML